MDDRDVLDLGPATAEAVRLLDAVPDAGLDGPTPCVGTSVRDLLAHLQTLSTAFTCVARHEPLPDLPPGPALPPGDALSPRWREELPEQLRALAVAWRDEAAYEGRATVGGVDMSRAEAAAVALDEVVLHGWDLARATGQEFRCDPASAQVALAFTTSVAQLPEQSRRGLFGPVVPVPEDAPALERALGLAGRDPAWQPA